MITNTSGRQVESNGVLAEVDFHLDPKSLPHIAAILRGMYSDPVRAVLRELACNALDAHNQVGVTRPIEITLPTATAPEFAVRDFGPGLNDDDTAQLLCGYGSSGSHKRISNKQVGGFGIGAKCPFAIASQFQYIIHHGGRRKIWSCYLDESDIGKAAMLSDEASTEPTGIEVRVPVKSEHLDRFLTCAETEFLYWQTPPLCDGRPANAAGSGIMAGSLAVTVADVKHKVDWNLYSTEAPGGGGIVMGGVLYPFDAAKLENYQNKYANFELFLGTLILRAPIGFVQIAPNREALQYSTATKRTIEAILQTFTSDTFISDLAERSAKSGTIRNRALLTLSIQNSFRMVASALNNWKKSGASWADMWATPHDYYVKAPFTERDAGIRLVSRVHQAYRKLLGLNGYGPVSKVEVEPCLESQMAKGKISIGSPADLQYIVHTPNISTTESISGEKTDNDDFEQGDKVQQRRIVEAVLRRTHGITASSEMPKLMTNMDNLKLTCLVSGAPMQDLQSIPWVKDGSVKVVELQDLLDEVPAVTEGLFYAGTSSRSTGHTYSLRSSNRVTRVQHSRKLVSLKLDSTSYANVNSEYWSPMKVQDSKGGVYVSIDRFEILPRAKACHGTVPNHIISWLQGHPVVLKGQPLLGVRVGKDKESLQAKPAYVELWDNIRGRIQAALTDGTATVPGLMLLLRELALNKVLKGAKQDRQAWYRTLCTMQHFGSMGQLDKTWVRNKVLAWDKIRSTVTDPDVSKLVDAIIDLQTDVRLNFVGGDDWHLFGTFDRALPEAAELRAFLETGVSETTYPCCGLENRGGYGPPALSADSDKPNQVHLWQKEPVNNKVEWNGIMKEMCTRYPVLMAAVFDGPETTKLALSDAGMVEYIRVKGE